MGKERVGDETFTITEPEKLLRDVIIRDTATWERRGREMKPLPLQNLKSYCVTSLSEIQRHGKGEGER